MNRIISSDKNPMKKKKIAVIANGWSSEYIGKVLEGIRREATKDNVDIFVFVTYIFWGEMSIQSKCQLNLFHLPNPKDFDGVIVLSNTFNLPDEAERVRALFQRKKIPMVCTESHLPDMAFVGTDNKKGMRELAEHIIDKHNVKKVVYVSGIEGNAECAERKQTLEDVLTEHDLKLIGEYKGDFGFYNAYVKTIEWIKTGDEMADAFVCANDHMAMGVVAALREMGYEVPRDVIVTGFDFIDESKNTYPILATVSRKWNELGEYAYKELKNQIECQDTSVQRVYESEFIPSESCGCEASKEAQEIRMNSLKTGYARTTESNMQDILLQNFRVAMSKVDNKEDFHEVAIDILKDAIFLGDDYCICTEPLFFETDDENYPQRIRGYSKTLDILFERSNGEDLPLRTFPSKEIYPGYKKNPNQSNIYIFAPINHLEYIVGYFAVKNHPELLYDLSLKKWVGEMNSMFVTIRNYIFAKQTAQALKKIYMTDFLTGINNRTGCEKVLFKFIEEEKKFGRSTILLFADINGMKIINDVYGHLNGDLAIKATANAMQESLPGSWMLGRYGGDEFVAVGPSVGDDFAQTIRDNLSASIENVISGLKITFDLSVSVGYTIIHPNDEGTIEDYIALADASMYEEKKKAHKKMGIE